MLDIFDNTGAGSGSYLLAPIIPQAPPATPSLAMWEGEPGFGDLGWIPWPPRAFVCGGSQEPRYGKQNEKLLKNVTSNPPQNKKRRASVGKELLGRCWKSRDVVPGRWMLA